MPSTYLAHHGIIGQKWGVRRFQNKDGTLTKAGQRRYQKLESEMKQLKPDSKGDSTESHETESVESPKPKRVSEMTDQDLKNLIARMENEKKYRQLYNELNPPPVRGKSLTQEYLAKAGTSLADALIQKGSQAIAKKIVDSIVGSSSDDDKNQNNNKKSNNNNNNQNNKQNSKTNVKETRTERIKNDITEYEFNQRKKADRLAAREERNTKREERAAARDAYYERLSLEADQRDAERRARRSEAVSNFANRYLIESEDDRKKRSRRRSYYDMFG